MVATESKLVKRYRQVYHTNLKIETMNPILKDIQAEIEKLENQISKNPNEDYDELFFSIENQFEQIRDFEYNEFDTNLLANIRKRIKNLRNELDVFDENAERDAMFPNGEDE